MGGITIDASSSCDRLAKHLDRMVNGSGSINPAARALSGCHFSIGPANDTQYGVPSNAVDPIFIGDAKWVNEPQIDAATQALFERDPFSFQMRPRFNAATQRWDMEFRHRSAGDAPSFDPIAGQLFSPWNVSFLSKVFKEPLTWTGVDKMVSYEAGSSPWAEIFTILMEQYAGWAMAGQAGSLQNNMISDVNVKDGLMSSIVINLTGSYTLTLEEQIRQGSMSPVGVSPMARKQSYLNYAMNMLKAIIAYYGNDETNTSGLLQVSPVIAVSAADSLKTLAAGTQAGYQMYKRLAGYINEMIVASDGKFQSFKWAMSPEALSLLRSTPYSETYDPTAAMAIFLKNYGVTTKDGGVPSVEFVNEPLLKANTELNPSPADLSIITVPSVGAGPTDEQQPIAIFGQPLSSYVFPAVPGQYNTQFKTLSRVAGILAPVPSGIKCFRGLGVQ